MSEENSTYGQVPIPMLLFCPQCGVQHVDAPQPEKNWTNPPHRSHECQGCGHVWRPADVATTGIAELTSRGSRDDSPVPRAAAAEAAVELLTPDEFAAMEKICAVYQAIRRIIGDGSASEGDVRELAYTIHILQQMVMAQAAARAYPDRFRLLGGQPCGENRG